MNYLLLLSIGICFLALGIWLVFNECRFRRNAVAVDGIAVGYKQVRGPSGESNSLYSYSLEVIFTCPFTKIKRRVTSIMGSERQPDIIPNIKVVVYVSSEPPHRYRLESPMYLLGNVAMIVGVNTSVS